MEKNPKEGNKKTERKKSTNYKIRCQKCISNCSCVREIILIDLKNPVICYFQEINISIRIERAMLKIKVWKKYGEQVLIKRKVGVDIFISNEIVIRAIIIPSDRRLPYDDKGSVHFIFYQI